MSTDAARPRVIGFAGHEALVASDLTVLDHNGGRVGVFRTAENIRRGVAVSRLPNGLVCEAVSPQPSGSGPGDRLHKLADLFNSRNTEYGAAYETVGGVLAKLFPNAVTLDSANDFVRFALICRIADKLTRYANNFARGGHPDSLDDLAVLAAILRTVDGE